MHKNSKKQISHANNYIIKSRKIISILVVFLLITTVISSVASSARIGSGIVKKIVEEVKDTDDTNTPIKTYIEEKTQQIKEKTQNLKEKITEKITQFKENRKGISIKTTGILSRIASFVESIRSYFPLKKSVSSGRYLYTKYADDEPIETKMRLLTATYVDLNDDGTNDIKARYSIFPFIEKPLALSFNIKLTIERLDGFNDLDINEFFEAYVQFTFPGLLNKDMAGNQVRFGCQSENGEEIPSVCHITYKYTPYFFHKEKPLHTTIFDPDKSTNKDINLLFSYAHADGETFTSKDNFNIKLEPAVYTEITFGGLDSFVGRSLNFYSSDKSTATIQYTREKNGSSFKAGLIINKISSFRIDLVLTPLSKGGGKIEYIRSSEDPIDATLFFEANASAYIYVDDIPQIVTLSWLPELDGLIQLNSSSPVSEVGIQNALHDEDATAKAYILGLPTKIELRWNLNLKTGEVELFTDSGGCSAHVYASDLLGTGAQLSVDIYTLENINISVFWNFTEKSFGIKRTNSNLTISASLINLSGISASFYCEVDNNITSPFIIYFDKTDKATGIDVKFTGNEITVSNLEVNVDIPSLGGFAIEMDKLVISDQCSLSFSFSVNKSENQTTIELIIDITNDLYIENISFWYNSSIILTLENITSIGGWYQAYTLTIYDADIEWGGDAQNGYLYIHGGAGITFTFDTNRKINGEVIATASGSVTFETDEGLNISWTTNSTGNLTFSIIGGGAITLSGFSFWLKDKLEVSVGEFSGSFNLNTEEKTGEIILFIDDGSASFDFDVNISFNNSEELFFAANIYADIGVGLSGELIVSWNETGATIEGNVEPGIFGELGIGYLGFHYGNKTSDTVIRLSAQRVTISGDFSFSLGFSLNNIDFDTDFLGTLSIGSFHLYAISPTFGPISIDIDEFSLTGSGYINIDIDIASEPETKIENLKVTVYADASVGLDTFDVSLPLNESTIHVELSFSRVTLNGKLVFEICDNTISVGVYLAYNSPFRIDDFYLNLNDDLLVVSWDELFLLLGGGGKITFKKESFEVQSIIIDAIFNQLNFKNFEFALNANLADGSILAIDGGVSVTSSGPLTIRASVGGCTEPYFQVLLSNGFIDADDLNIIVYKLKDDAGGVEPQKQPILKAGWESLHIGGSFYFDLKITENEKSDKLINIHTSGNGDITLDNAAVYANIVMQDKPLIVDISLDYFKIELDNFTGSVIDLLIDLKTSKFDISSAGGSGSISDITITNFNVTIDTNEKIFNLTDLLINFKGEGVFSMSFEKDEEDIHHLKINGEITTTQNGFIKINYLELISDFLSTKIEGFELLASDQGPTIIHINAGGKIDFDPEDPLDALQHLYLDAGCTSFWNARKIDIGGVFGINNFTGYGDLTAGIELDYQHPYGGDFVVGISGDLYWDNFRLLPTINLTTYEWNEGLPLLYGDFTGDIEIRIDLITFITLFFAPFAALLYARIKLIAYSYSDINLLDIAPLLGIGSGIHLLSFEFGPGELELSWNATSNPLYFYYNSTVDISAYLGEIHLGSDYIFSFRELELHEGNASFLFYHNPDTPGIGEIILNNTGTIKPTWGKLNLRDKNTGDDIVTIKEVSGNCPYLNVKWDLNGDLIGYLWVDTNGLPLTFLNFTLLDRFSFAGLIQTDDLLIDWDIDGDLTGHITIDSNMNDCYLALTIWTLTIGDIISVSGGFRANGWGFNWNFNGPPGTWYFEKTGTLEFIGGFSLGVYDTQEQTWYYWPDSLVAAFDWTPSSPDIEQEITFDASGSYCPNGDITKYEWKWFDVDDWHDSGNGGTNPIETHTYDIEGVYEVSLRVWDGLKFDTCSHIIAVASNPLNINLIYDGNKLVENLDFTVIIKDKNNNRVANVDIVFEKSFISGIWEFVSSGQTDNNGEIIFTAPEVPEQYEHISGRITATKTDYDTGVKVFTIHDDKGELYGKVINPTMDPPNNGVGGATVETTDGQYSTTTLNVGGVSDGTYSLDVESGTYTIRVTHPDYITETFGPFTFAPGQNIHADLEIMPDNTVPVAVITGTYTGEMGEEIEFDPMSSYDPDPGDQVDEMRWHWDYDGGPYGWDNWVDFEDNSPFSKRTYYESGVYTVALQVRDLMGSVSNIATTTVTITGSEYVKPDTHTNNIWNFESRSYDDDGSSCAYYSSITTGDGWCNKPLILEMNNDISCTGFRYKAKNDYDDGNSGAFERIKFTFKDGITVRRTLEYTDWDWHYSWNSDNFNSINIDRVEIEFKLNDGFTFGGLDPHWACVYNFEFLKE